MTTSRKHTTGVRTIQTSNPKPSTRGVLLYLPNNSGGRWWLSTKDYERLAAEGWVVHWAQRRREGVTIREYEHPLRPRKRQRGLKWLGAEAGSCAKRFASPSDGIAEWERITGQNAASLGCGCCGPPHSFEWKGDDGRTKYISPMAPMYGDLGDL